MTYIHSSEDYPDPRSVEEIIGSMAEEIDDLESELEAREYELAIYIAFVKSLGYRFDDVLKWGEE